MSVWEGQALAVGDVERTLRAMWQESTDSDRGVTHVRTLNLIIFVPINYAGGELQRTIDEVALQHPGRTITLLVSDDSQPAAAQVSLACRLGDDGKQVCGEQIMLRSGERGAPLTSTVEALLIPGLPVYLWWLGDPLFDSSVFAMLTEAADRVVLDARTWRTPQATLQALAHAMQGMPRLAFTDLLWTALTPWRRSIAQCFDLPDSLPHLQRLEHINITYGPAQSDMIAAYLIVGWLGSRLGWRVDHDQHLRRADGTPITLVFQQHVTDGLDAIALHSADGSFTVMRRDQAACADVTITVPSTALHLVAPLKEQSLAALLGEELMMLEHDRGYETAVRFAAQII